MYSEQYQDALCISSTTSYQPLGTAIHVPVAAGHFGAIEAGLWKRYAGRPRSLSSMSSTVGIECSSTADLSHEIHITDALVSLHWLCVRADRVEDRCAVVRSPTGVCATEPGTSLPGHGSARPTNTALCQLW